MDSQTSHTGSGNGTGVGSVIQPTRFAFGVFEADLSTGELKRSGHRLRFQSQPFRVLAVLLQKPGAVVSREELQLKVWGSDVVVDFEHGLGNAVKKIRDAIGDSAENPRFIETVARRGYRFIAPVTPLYDSATASPSAPPQAIPDPPPVPAEPEPAPAPSPVATGSIVHSSPWLFAGLLCALAILLSAFFLQRHRDVVPAPHRISQLSVNGGIYPQVFRSLETLSPLAVEEGRIFSSALEHSHITLLETDIDTGLERQVLLPAEVQEPEVDDISPDGTKLLVRSHSGVELQEAEQPLWVVPTNGGSAFRVGDVLSHDATWTPDGKGILYANGDRLEKVALDGGPSQLVANVPGRAFWLRWSSDGKLLRFTIVDLRRNASSLWELSRGDQHAHPLSFGLQDVDKVCCGTWTSDGKYFVLQGIQRGFSDLWELEGNSTTGAHKLTSGPLNYGSPAAGKRDQIYFLGIDTMAPVEQRKYDPTRKEFVPIADFLREAVRITYSLDHQWVAWMDVLGHLWRARADGSEKLQLTSGSFLVLNCSWSPDDRTLAIMARNPNHVYKLFWIGRSGGKVDPVLPADARAVGDPSFSPDGKSLAFAGLPILMGGDAAHPSSIHILDLGTGTVTDLPDSKGLFSPRWSPDGRYIAALTLDQHQLMLYDVARKTWMPVATMSVSDPLWAPDSKSLYFYASVSESRPIYRIGIPDHKLREAYYPACGRYSCFLSGIAPDNQPLIRVDQTRSNIYSMNLGPS